MLLPWSKKSKRIREIKPNVVISADVIPFHTESTEQGHSSINGENMGLVDVLCRMAYYLDIDVKMNETISQSSKESGCAGGGHFKRIQR